MPTYPITQRQVQGSRRTQYYILCTTRSRRVLRRVFKLPVPGRGSGRGGCDRESGLLKIRLYEIGEDCWEQERQGPSGHVGDGKRDVVEAWDTCAAGYGCRRVWVPRGMGMGMGCI